MRSSKKTQLQGPILRQKPLHNLHVQSARFQFLQVSCGFWKVLESYGNWQCNFPGPGKFLEKERSFQNGYGKVLDFCLGKS